MTEEEIEARIWMPHNEWAGDELYSMCIDLRGFYLKVRDTFMQVATCAGLFSAWESHEVPCGRLVQVGQFIGTRSDFIAEPVCRRLSLLQDQVQPLDYPAAPRPVVLEPVGRHGRRQSPIRGL